MGFDRYKSADYYYLLQQQLKKNTELTICDTFNLLVFFLLLLFLPFIPVMIFNYIGTYCMEHAQPIDLSQYSNTSYT